MLATAIAAWVGENIAIGPFPVTEDKGSRYLIEDAPEGVFLDNGRMWPW